MGTETMKGSNYAWAIAVACVAFYAIPLGVVANQAGLFASPVMEEFGWSRTDATLYMSIQPWVAAICTPFAGKLISRFNPRWVMTAAAAVRLGFAGLCLVHRAVAVERVRRAVRRVRRVLDVHRHADVHQPLVR